MTTDRGNWPRGMWSDWVDLMRAKSMLCMAVFSGLQVSFAVQNLYLPSTSKSLTNECNLAHFVSSGWFAGFGPERFPICQVNVMLLAREEHHHRSPGNKIQLWRGSSNTDTSGCLRGNQNNGEPVCSRSSRMRHQRRIRARIGEGERSLGDMGTILPRMVRKKQEGCLRPVTRTGCRWVRIRPSVK